MPYENAYAARVENGIVRQVIVIPYMDDDDATITAYCNAIGLAGIWKDCSFLGARRGCYPSAGYTYDAQLDEYLPPQSSEDDE
jgi:hypothetical protein